MTRRATPLVKAPATLALLALLAVFALAAPRAVRAMEGGTSHYIQGAYGDFMMAYIPGPGLYLRNDFLFQSARVGGTALGGRAYGGLDAKIFLNITKLTYLADVPAIGGYLGLGLGLPIIVNEHIGGDLAADYLLKSHKTKQFREGHFQKAGGGDRGGVSDIFLMPLIAGWKFGECHLVVTPLLFLPTGYYNPSVLTNLGMNYLTFDGNAAFTWLGKGGYEISFNAGYMLSSENRTTNYQSGNELHFDWTAAYHVNERLALGAVGYLYAQTTPDTGSGAMLGSYMSSAAGIGPAVTYTATIGKTDLTLIAKWLHDIGAKNRFMGDMFYTSFALKF